MKTRIYLQISVPIQPKTSNILPKFCRSAVVSPTGALVPWCPGRSSGRPRASSRRRAPHGAAGRCLQSRLGQGCLFEQTTTRGGGGVVFSALLPAKFIQILQTYDIFRNSKKFHLTIWFVKFRQNYIKIDCKNY